MRLVFSSFVLRRATRASWVAGALVAVLHVGDPAPSAAQGDFHVDTNSTFGLTLFLFDSFGNPIPNTTLTNIRIDPNYGEGGHNHGDPPGGAQFIMARVTPTTCSTGWNGYGCGLSIRANSAGGSFLLLATIGSGPQTGQTFTMNGTVFVGAVGGYDLTDLAAYGPQNFTLVGQTGTHPDNHYCQTDICERSINLANDYVIAWSLNLAYNDMGLRKGGVFDINNNFAAPHSEHRTGRNIDVRANGGPQSLPFDPAIRDWFVNRVIELFGQAPLHESAGTSNEHYHIRG